MTIIERLNPHNFRDHLPALIDLLRDAVDGGASIGFLPPLSEAEARAYWLDVLDGLSGGSRIVLAALVDGRAVGSVQLELAGRPNGRHRAEVQKLIVHRDNRGQGIAGRLMSAIESEAKTAARSLLVLDTRRGDTAEHLYRKWGWTEAGVIPRFALNATGELDDTVIFYKHLS